jgi:hypothetical protein
MAIPRIFSGGGGGGANTMVSLFYLISHKIIIASSNLFAIVLTKNKTILEKYFFPRVIP